MELEVFAGQEKSELSMIEVARAILELRGRDHEMHFSDLVNEIQNYLGTSNSDIREALPLFYTELNFDGSFISLGDNKWGLRSWYGVDEIDEEIIALEENDDDEVAPKAKKNVSMPSWMVIQMLLTTMQMIQKTKMHTKQIQLFHTMMKIQMMRKMKWKLTMQKSTKSLLMTWVKTWILTKKMTSFQTMILKTSRNKS